MCAINEERILKESTWMLLTKLYHYHFSKDIKNLCMHYQMWSQQKSEEKRHICKILRFKDFLRWCLYEKKRPGYSTSWLIWLLLLLRFSLNVFLHSLKISHMHFMSKNVPAKRDETFVWEKNVPPKRDPDFMKVVSLLGGRIYFHINRSWFFNRTLL